MRFFLTALLILSPFSGFSQQHQSQKSSTPETIARLFRPGIQKIDKELKELEKHLANLPESGRTRVTNRVGFHSLPMKRRQKHEWVQIDLRTKQPIDLIALVPLNTESPLYPDGYGFPVRFKVEIANQENFSDAVVLLDATEQDFQNPGSYPVLVQGEKKEARFVRVTSTKHYAAVEDFVWGLGELMVLSGNYNVASGKPVTASNSLPMPNTWSAGNLTDWQSTIGMPVSTRQSPTNGWLSDEADDEKEEKWVEIDLGKPVKVDEIRIFPAQPTDLGDTPGTGFPEGFVLTAGANSGEDIVVAEWVNQFFPNPQGNPVVFDAPQTKIRFIKMRATKIQRQGDFSKFGLAEIQAYSDGKNIALGKPVEVSGSAPEEEFPRWAPEFLVDGFTSQYHLIEIPEYLRKLEERRQALVRRTELRRKRDSETEEVLTFLAVFSTAVFLGLIIFMSVALTRQHRIRLAETKRLRTQIARDLHDDIGSNLGSIALTSQMALGDKKLPDQAVTDFEEIHTVAERTAESMRDLVWLIDTESRTFEDLFAKMRDAVNRLLTEVSYDITIEPTAIGDDEVALRFRRHVFFGFKECLNNIRKHAGANSVKIWIGIKGNNLSWIIEDDGKGFDMENRREAGRGVSNIKDRAGRLNGTCEISSQPECGTVVSFEIPLKSSREH